MRSDISRRLQPGYIFSKNDTGSLRRDMLFLSGQQNYSSLRAHKVLYNEKVAARSSAYISDIQIMSVTTRHSGCSCNRKRKHGAVDDHRQSMAAKLCSSRTHTGKFCQRYTTHGTLN
jgi:hypothetical protein